MDTNTIKSEHIHDEKSALGQDVQTAGGTSDDEGTEPDKVSIEHGEPLSNSLVLMV